MTDHFVLIHRIILGPLPHLTKIKLTVTSNENPCGEYNAHGVHLMIHLMIHFSIEKSLKVRP
jgi:hypothetical protein